MYRTLFLVLILIVYSSAERPVRFAPKRDTIQLAPITVNIYTIDSLKLEKEEMLEQAKVDEYCIAYERNRIDSLFTVADSLNKVASCSQQTSSIGFFAQEAKYQAIFALNDWKKSYPMTALLEAKIKELDKKNQKAKVFLKKASIAQILFGTAGVALTAVDGTRKMEWNLEHVTSFVLSGSLIISGVFILNY